MVNISLFDTPNRAIPLAIAIYLSIYLCVEKFWRSETDAVE